MPKRRLPFRTTSVSKETCGGTFQSSSSLFNQQGGTIDTLILGIATRGLQLVRKRLFENEQLFVTEIRHLLGTATEAHSLAQEITAPFDTLAGDIIVEEA